MSKLVNQYSSEQKKILAEECYKKIKEDKIDFKIKGSTVIFTDPKQLDSKFYNSVVYCDPNELLRLCSQVIN